MTGGWVAVRWRVYAQSFKLGVLRSWIDREYKLLFTPLAIGAGSSDTVRLTMTGDGDHGEGTQVSRWSPLYGYGVSPDLSWLPELLPWGDRLRSLWKATNLYIGQP